MSVGAKSKYALLVGISNYKAYDPKTEWNDIHGTNDVALIEPLLKQQGFQTDKLLDGKATYKNIVARLKALVRRTTEGATVYLHFSCHGQPYEDLDGDEEDGWDESIVPVDAPLSYEKGIYEGSRHLIDDELNIYVESLRKKVGPQGCVYVVIDACHAGRSSRDFDEVEHTRGTKRGFSPNGLYYKPKRERETHYKLQSSRQKAPVTYLEACLSTQSNSEVKRDGKYYGPLSFHIAQVIKDHSIGSDNRWAYRVQQLMRADNQIQSQDMVIESSR